CMRPSIASIGSASACPTLRSPASRRRPALCRARPRRAARRADGRPGRVPQRADGLLGGRCAVTGLAPPEVLRASHIKPWADCATEVERLDVFNGLRLAPNLDAEFDRSFVTVADDGAVLASTALGAKAAALLGIAPAMHVAQLSPRHRHYLDW